MNRLVREEITISKMIDLYCRNNHNNCDNLCDDCTALKEYAFNRLLNCPFEENKPVCTNCTVHCYMPDMRQKAKDVMRYSGPKMLFRHPYLAIMHLLNEKFTKPADIRSKADTEQRSRKRS